eukprot:symbB.v1.2.035395.t1/scaffold4755.1/size35387/1
MFLLYMLVLHILAMVGFWSIMSSGRRRFNSTESQTYLHTGDQETQTAEVQRSEPSAGSTAKATGGPNKISTVVTAIAASAPFDSSSVAITSAPASTDIQRIPPEKQQQLREEALKRHAMGDLRSARRPAAEPPLEPPPLARIKKATLPKAAAIPPMPRERVARAGMPMASALRGEWCCLCGPRPTFRFHRRRTPPDPVVSTAGPPVVVETAGPAVPKPTVEELELQKLRSLDKGVPQLRHLHGELAMKTQQLRSNPVNFKKVEEEYCTLQQMLQEAVEARDLILQSAISYKPRASPESRKAVLQRKVPNGDSGLRARAHFPSGRRKILLMGVYHSCTNAMAKELERHFDVEILNDWHTCKADENWKHRANSRRPPAVKDDVFCVLMAKEPHFWLQSCSRELRNFFELRPVGPQRRELPAQELWQLLSSIEHDGVLYDNAMDLWNDTMHSYLDDNVYPAHQSVIVRCEDFLFSYREVMEALQKLGALNFLPNVTLASAPLAERAKGHKECRTRDEALDFYSNPKNQKAAFTSDQLTLIRFALDQKAMMQLGYDQSDCVQRWAAGHQ